MFKAAVHRLPLPTRRLLGRARQLAALAMYAVTGRTPAWSKYADPRGYWDRRPLLAEDQQTGAHSSRPAIDGRNTFFDVLTRDPFRLVLDAGCGYGRELKPLSERFPAAKAIGVDFSFNQLQDARRYAPSSHGRLVQASLTALPFRDDVFDATYTNSVLTMIPNAASQPVFDELTRVTRGRILHREVLRHHLVSAGRTSLVRAMDLSAHCFSHDYEEEYRKRGCDVVCAEPLESYRNQPATGPEELWYSLVVVRARPESAVSGSSEDGPAGSGAVRT